MGFGRGGEGVPGWEMYVDTVGILGGDSVLLVRLGTSVSGSYECLEGQGVRMESPFSSVEIRLRYF